MARKIKKPRNEFVKIERRAASARCGALQHQRRTFSLRKTLSKYLLKVNLSAEQEAAVKFLSEALSISTQNAHIICNECK